MRFTRGISFALAVLACAAAAAVTYAAAYPERPITIIIPYPPGGATHIVTATVAREMEQHLGQPVKLEHKAGRDGMIALEAAGKAAPDGYTLMAGNPTTNAVNPVVRRRQLPFDYAQAIAPGGTLQEIIDKLHRAVVVAVGSPAVREEFEKRSIIAVTSRSPEAFAANLKADIAQKEEIVAETGIVVE
jgi:tripartite-type tricarboxylate transporter receptor subunit TctC